MERSLPISPKKEVHIYRNPNGGWILLDEKETVLNQQSYKSANDALESAREICKKRKHDFEIFIHNDYTDLPSLGLAG